MRTRAGIFSAALAALILLPATSTAYAGAADPAPILIDRNPVPLHLSPEPGRIEMMNGRGDLVGTVADGSTPATIGEWQRYGDFWSFGNDDDTYLHAMNDRGHIVGDDDGVPYAGMLWRDKESITLSLAGTVVWAEAVNNHDQVVGDLSAIAGSRTQAFSWQNGVFTRLPTPEGMASYAVDVNDRGQVLGMLANADWTSTHGAVWEHGRLTVVGRLNGPDTSVRAINNRGQVIGISDGRPFLWSGGRMRDLLAGTDASTGYTMALNDAGTVIGEADFQPVVWTRDGMRYLLPAGYSGIERSINPRGDIAGIMYPGTAPDERTAVLFRWRDGVMTYYGAPSGSRPALRGMDDRGGLVGTVTSDQGVRQWVRWSSR
jgi:probable HAF family extracellular repeat protein